MKKLNLIGLVFGQLTVTGGPSIKNGRTLWECLCSCGNTVNVLGTNLVKGNTKSCGCIRGKNLITHGMSTHPCFVHWRSMRQRCLNVNSSDYERYGGRGITICKEWDDINIFIKDMGEPPIYYTLERIDNSGPYCKSNCRWASHKEQSRNRSNTPRVSPTKTLKEWCSENKIDYRLAFDRFNRGMSLDDIKNTPKICRYTEKQECCINGCSNKVKTRNMCNKHYLQWWKGVLHEP